MPTSTGEWLPITASATTTTWTAWNQNWTAGTATTVTYVANNTIWTAWNDDRYTYQLPTPTEEERRAAEVRQQEHAAAILAARDAAVTLLTSFLDIAQRALYEAENRFLVTSNLGRVFEITCAGISGNVYLLEDGRRVTKYCAHPVGVPMADVHLAQKFLLETDEAEFCRIANASPVYTNRGAVAA